jgi:hypothetical protein
MPRCPLRNRSHCSVRCVHICPDRSSGHNPSCCSPDYIGSPLPRCTPYSVRRPAQRPSPQLTWHTTIRGVATIRNHNSAVGGDNPEAALPAAFARAMQEALKPAMTGGLSRGLNRAMARAFSGAMTRAVSRAFRSAMPCAMAHAVHDAVDNPVDDGFADAVGFALAEAMRYAVKGPLTDAFRRAM